MIEISKISTLQEIRSVVLQCADDLFDQNVNEESKLNALADKFARFAEVAVAQENDTCLGYVAYYCNNQETKTAYISIIVIKKEYQGKGVGSLLYNSVISVLKQKGFTTLKLEVAKQNTTALSFYSKKGFNVIEDRSSSFLLQIIF